MGSSELQLQQQQLPGQQQHPHDQFQQLYCQQVKQQQQQQQQHQQHQQQPHQQPKQEELPNNKRQESLAHIDVSDRPKKASLHDTEQDEERHQQAYSLSWKEFPSNFISFFKELQEAEELVDVTLACEGRQVSAHKVVLAASSPFFRRLLKSNPCQHPIVILNEVRYSELTPLLHYMYHGEVNVHYDQITNFLRTARLLQVRGLTGETSSAAETLPTKDEKTPKEPPKEEKKTPPLERHSSSPELEERHTTSSPAPKRPRITNSIGVFGVGGPFGPSLGGSPASPIPRTEDLSPPNISPPTLGTLPGGLPPLPPIPGLSLPLSLPSTMASLPPVTSSLPPVIPSHCPPSIPSSSPFPHLFAPHYGQPPPQQQQPPGHPPSQGHSDDASDTCASDRSEERPRGELDVEDDHDNSLEKMSGLANMAALKGLAGFPGPSGLMGLASGAGMGPNADHSPGRARFDFYRVRATDPRPCHLCGKIYKNAHTLRTHMEDKHSNCNGFRCVLCGTVAKSRNSLHSHMSRQHRGISTKDLPLLPMPAPWNPEMASKYIQLVGGVGEVVRQNYRRPDRENSGSREHNRESTLGSDASTPTSQENGALSPYLKSDSEKDRRAYETMTRQLEMSGYGSKPVAASLLDTYLQMMRASGVDLMHGMQEKAWEELRQTALASRGGVLDLTRNTGSPPTYDDEDARGSDHFSEDECSGGGGVGKGENTNGRREIVNMNPRSPEPSDNEDETKWAIP